MATSGLVGGPFSEGAAALAAAISVTTGGAAAGMDCIDNLGGIDCFIGLAGTGAGLAGPIANDLNSALDFGEDVVRAVDWVGQVGAAGFTVGGFLNALFGGGG